MTSELIHDGDGPTAPAALVGDTIGAPPTDTMLSSASEERLAAGALLTGTFLIVKDWLDIPPTDGRQIIALALFAFSIPLYALEVGVVWLHHGEDVEISNWLTPYPLFAAIIATVAALGFAFWYVAWPVAVVFLITSVAVIAGYIWLFPSDPTLDAETGSDASDEPSAEQAQNG